MMEALQPVPDLSAVRSTLDQAVGRRSALEDRIAATKVEIAALDNEQALCDLVCELFRQLIDAEVGEGVKAVESLLTEGLSAVFNDQEISVRSEISVKSGKVNVDLITQQVQDDGTITEGATNDAFGGAVTTVQSILLRLTVVLRRGLRPLLLLDETLPARSSPHEGKLVLLACDDVVVSRCNEVVSLSTAEFAKSWVTWNYNDDVLYNPVTLDPDSFTSARPTHANTLHHTTYVFPMTKY